MVLRRVPTWAALTSSAVLALTACTSGADGTDPVTGATTAPSATATAPPATTATPVVPPATPTAFSTANGPTGLTFRDYLGASVPGGAAGPRTVAAGTASGWTRDAAGAVLAAAHVAVAADARQPRALWRPVVDGGVPRSRVERVRTRTERAAAQWDSRLTADERARRDRPSDTDAGQGPPSIWSPPVRVVAYSGLTSDRRLASVTIWARTAGSATWMRRTVRLQWARGDWRARFPLPSGWAAEPPTADIRPISELSS
ncbi:hypothetical protein [Solicola sp. PLA-1-18]|uniref:hypothetical protein n=1 Tax=Solicola sp. PLA-1-18 TaxID=3380532 RepID=UPI003B80EB5B